jgi:hypothetical protein
MNVQARIAVERSIVKEVIKAALAAGYLLTVNDGEEDTLIASDKSSAIVSAMFTTDEDRLWFVDKTTRNKIGWVYFIYGNDGYDVINDYTTNLEEVLASANHLADELSE